MIAEKRKLFYSLSFFPIFSFLFSPLSVAPDESG